MSAKFHIGAISLLPGEVRTDMFEQRAGQAVSLFPIAQQPLQLSSQCHGVLGRNQTGIDLVGQYLGDAANGCCNNRTSKCASFEKDDAERQRRAVCAEIFRRTMVGAMGLLGIPVPERM